MVFSKRTALQQQFSKRVEYEYRESAVQKPFAMDFELGANADNLILFVYENKLIFHSSL